MIKKVLIVSLSLTSALVEAAPLPRDPQVYELKGNHENQVVMLSNWSVGKTFSEYQDYRQLTYKFFSENQPVWIWCQGKTVANTIEKIHTYAAGATTMTSIILADDPGCNENPLLMSNYEFPKQRWQAREVTPKELENIRSKLPSEGNLKVTKIEIEELGVLFLIFDPQIPTIYDTGGYRLLDEQLNQISMFENAPLTPLIDLDNDGVPEFFFPSSDGMDAWLYKLFPHVNREMSHQ